MTVKLRVCFYTLTSCPKFGEYYNSIEPAGYPGGGCSLPSDWGEFSLSTYSDSSFSVVFENCNISTDEFESCYHSFQLYPNPADSFVRIKHINTPHLIIVTVINSIGEVYRQFEVDLSKNETINTSNFSEGVFFIIIRASLTKDFLSSYTLLINH